MRKNMFSKFCNIETPFYLYDRRQIIQNITTLKRYFRTTRAQIFFAVKANTALAILKTIKKAGLGAEVVSPGEVFICLKAGFAPTQILYNNIARKKEDIVYALKKGVKYFNFEAIDQARRLDQCAGDLKKKLKLFVRLNPGIFPDTHAHLSTGAPASKFGIEASQLDQVIACAQGLRHSQLVGIHSHIGSQILSPKPFVRGARKVMHFVEYFIRHGIKIKYVNLGGGFGVPYKPAESRLNFKPIIKAYKKLCDQYRVKIFLEPGRFIVANAGYIVSSVISIKKRQGRLLYIIDAGMTENPRPALYGAYHHIEPIIKKKGRLQRVRIAGPLCENSDEFGVFSLPPLRLGDRLIIHNCGAYTRTMASNYNGRLLSAEYLLSRKRPYLIRKKQSYPALINNEIY